MYLLQVTLSTPPCLFHSTNTPKTVFIFPSKKIRQPKNQSRNDSRRATFVHYFFTGPGTDNHGWFVDLTVADKAKQSRGILRRRVVIGGVRDELLLAQTSPLALAMSHIMIFCHLSQLCFAGEEVITRARGGRGMSAAPYVCPWYVTVLFYLR